MDTNKLSGIVVYTIHENDLLRDALRKGITENFGGEFLDESTYGIPIHGAIRNDIVQSLKNICNKACNDSNSVFLENDFVCLYYPSNPEESGDNRYIRQVYIVSTY